MNRTAAAVVFSLLCISLFAEVPRSSLFTPLDANTGVVAEKAVVARRVTAADVLSVYFSGLACEKWAEAVDKLTRPPAETAGCKAAFDSLKAPDTCPRSQMSTVDVLTLSACGYKVPAGEKSVADQQWLKIGAATRSESTFDARLMSIEGTLRQSSVFDQMIDVNVAVEAAATPAPAAAPASTPSVEPISATGVAGGVPLSLEARLINGFADFVATRAQVELLNWIANDFAQNLCGGESARRFRNACRVLISDVGDGTKPIDFRQLGSAFQSALSRDLDAFIELEIRTALVSPPGLEQEITAAIGAPLTIDDIRQAFVSQARSALQGWAVRENVALTDLPLNGGAAALRAWLVGLDAALAERRLRSLMASSEYASTGTWRNELAAAALARVVMEVRSRNPVPPDVPATIVAALPREQMTPAIRTWLVRRDVDVANAVRIGTKAYDVLQGLRRRQNPVSLIISATEALPCAGTAKRDLGCTVQFMGIALTAIVTVDPAAGKDWTQLQLDSDTAAFLEKALADYRAILAADAQAANPKYAGLRSWLRLQDAAFDARISEIVTQLLPRLLVVRDSVSRVQMLARADAARPENVSLLKQASLDVISHSIELLRSIVELPDAEGAFQRAVDLLDDLEVAWTAYTTRNYPVLLESTLALASALSIEVPVPDAVSEYLPMISAFASAETPDQVSAALQRYAAPLTSWRAKQTFARSSWFNAWVGGVGGAVIANSDSGRSGDLALFAPVGFDFANLLGRRSGLIVSVADIGNLVSIRVTSDDAKANDVDFSDIVAPGIGWRKSFANSPLVWGVMLSAVPQLEDEHGRAARLGVFFGIDVPIFSLTRTRMP